MTTSVTAYLTCDGASQAIDFYRAAFDATELTRMEDTDGRIGHAEIRIGETTLYVSDEYPELQVFGPLRRGGASAAYVIHVPDADASFDRAVKAGATVQRPLQDNPFGRSGWIVDPWGHRWSIMTDAAADGA